MPCPATPQARPQRIHNSLSPASGKGWLTKGTLAPRGGKKESLDQCGGVRGSLLGPLLQQQDPTGTLLESGAGQRGSAQPV